MTSSSVVAPDISVIVPVLHEGVTIASTLEQIAAIAGSIAYEVIVVDGDPQGSTLPYLPQGTLGIVSKAGRGHQMNAGAECAQGRILLFLHADTRLPSQALQKIVYTIEKTKAVAGAFDFSIDSPRWILGWISRGASLRTRLTRLPYGDQAIFIARTIFNALGGYPDFPILEDVELMRRLKRQRLPIALICDRVSVSARRWEQEGILFCTLRNWILLSLYYLGVSPHYLAKWYRPLSPLQKTEQKI
ncbi:MAG: TIGR04283 family arsenosugar biosynthesis glycosyltransferase [Cyanobacteria bacterium P01_A01_bin.17]